MTALTAVGSSNIESRGIAANAAAEKARETVGAVDRQIIGRGGVPDASQGFAGFHGVPAHWIDRDAGTHMKDYGCTARVDERQDDRAVRRIDVALNIDLVGQRARRANPLFLPRDADDYVIQSGDKGREIRAVEFAVRRQKAVGVR